MDTHPPRSAPFTPDPAADATDGELATRAVAGDRAAVEALLERHQRWIYNIAFRMVMVPHDAEDVTQEILLKVLTKLSTFDPTRGAFRTWLYRLVANHVINMRQRGYEAAISRIEDYYAFVANVPDQDPGASPEIQAVVEDIKVGCVMGTFLCLERSQRLAFILTMAFDVTDVEGGVIMEISREAFRQHLSRARARLHEFVRGNCGAINPAAPCRCEKKVKGFLAGGYSAERLSFVQDGAPTLGEVVGKRVEQFEREIYPEYERIVREQPFYRGPELTSWLRELVRRPELQQVFGQEGR